MPPQKGPSGVTQMPGQSTRGSQFGVAGLATQVCPFPQGGNPRLPQGIVFGFDVAGDAKATGRMAKKITADFIVLECFEDDWRFYAGRCNVQKIMI